jgi:hypothetical protein
VKTIAKVVVSPEHALNLKVALILEEAECAPEEIGGTVPIFPFG